VKQGGYDKRQKQPVQRRCIKGVIVLVRHVTKRKEVTHNDQADKKGKNPTTGNFIREGSLLKNQRAFMKARREYTKENLS